MVGLSSSITLFACGPGLRDTRSGALLHRPHPPPTLAEPRDRSGRGVSPAGPRKSGLLAVARGDPGGAAITEHATFGYLRPDVREYFAAQGILVPADSGFTFAWNSAAVGPGMHTLSIRAFYSVPGASTGPYDVASVAIRTEN